MSEIDLPAELAERVRAAEAALDAAAGSSSLCSLSRSGTPIPGIKYPEGAWVALRDVQRASASGVTSVPQAAEMVRARWADDEQRHRTRGSGADWIAYLTGGLDALDSFLEQITGHADSA